LEEAACLSSVNLALFSEGRKIEFGDNGRSVCRVTYTTCRCLVVLAVCDVSVDSVLLFTSKALILTWRFEEYV
jgi:hypothetical protein